MRRLIFAAVAVVALALFGTGGNRAEAMPLPTAGYQGNVRQFADNVFLRCTRVWNGWRWVRSCVEIEPGYYGPRDYDPRYGYGYGGWRSRPRFYGNY